MATSLDTDAEACATKFYANKTQYFLNDTNL